MAAGILATLDAALSGAAGPGAPSPGAGLAAAIRLNDLLARHRVGWDEVIASGGRLAKLCGRFGSAYPAERAAAYGHAVRLLRRRGVSWSEVVWLPPCLVDPPWARDARCPDAGCPDTGPPDSWRADWMATVHRLRAGRAWRSEVERLRLDFMAIDIAEGQAPDWREAKWLRDVWWHAKHTDPGMAGWHG